MQLGLTWPLQRMLRMTAPYGEPIDCAFCWDAHCISMHGRSSLLLVHCQSRYTIVRFGMSRFDWRSLSEISISEISIGLLEAGMPEKQIQKYLLAAGPISMTRTHGRREVAFLNRAWEDVLSADLLVDPNQHHQSAMSCAVNNRPCRCVGEVEIATAQEHLSRLILRCSWGREE